LPPVLAVPMVGPARTFLPAALMAAGRGAGGDEQAACIDGMGLAVVDGIFAGGDRDVLADDADPVADNDIATD
jgi:hypothetical protein